MFATRSARIIAVAVLLTPALTAQVPSASDPPRYVLPPKAIVDAFDAPPLPDALASPSHQALALLYRHAHPTIAELSQPMLRLAGMRINPKTNGPRLAGDVYAISVKRIADGSELKIAVPSQAHLAYVHFSPDGSRLSFVNTKDGGLELWVAETTTGAATVVSQSDRINATAGDPCDWLNDNATLICKTVPLGRGPAPAEPTVAPGPNIEDHNGKAAPAPTYEDLLKTVHDDELFEYYFTSQLVSYNVATGARTAIGEPAILTDVAVSRSGEYVLVTKVKRPFSHLIVLNGFPEDVEVWSRSGRVAKKIADVSSGEGVPLTGVQTGPRSVHWRSDEPATVLWTEALDGGDLKTKVPFRDKVLSLAAPFTASPTEVTKTEWRFAGISHTDKGVALVTEADRESHRTRTWIIEPGTQPRTLWDRKQESAYDNPGTPVARRRDLDAGFGGGRGGTAHAGPIIQNGDYIYLAGQGATPTGDRPFLDRLNIKTLATERLFRSAADAYETFVAPLGDDMNRFLTRYETPKDPPNYYSRNRDTTSKQPVTQFSDPQPQLRDAQHQLERYKRKDGVMLSGTLYTPPGYKKGDRVPVIMWAYPREFGDQNSAGQVTGSNNRFTLVGGYSHLFLLLSGYAVFDNPTMPIVGEGETANDHYVDQLVASAEAAIDQIVELGVGDRDHIGIGGHSYGGFMTGNLLAHSRLFRAGFAESAAYNRSLTPFGFQNERRTFWDAADLYARMSPFWYANQVKDPILLMHGEADDNSGTFPIQSERFYMALKGHGATVRYVRLPFEAHGYLARETLLHVLAERIAWFDRYVKNAQPRNTTDAAR